ncbi:MAG: response regulator [Arenicellales bacterium]
MEDNKIRVFIVDDDHTVGTGLSRLLHSAGYETEVFFSATDFLKRMPYHGMACLILDVRMPGISGTDLHKQLVENNINIPVIFLSAHGDLPMGIQAMKRGAEDFLQKPVDESVLLDAVNNALKKSSVKKSKSLAALTAREEEMLQYILGGATNSQIADFFQLSEKTVKAHRGKIMQKTGASSAAELGWICSSEIVSAKKL